MRYLLTFVFIAICIATQAQQQRRGTYTPKPKREKSAPLPPAKTEVGFDAGYSPIEYGGGPTARVVASARMQKHLQLFAGADVVLSGLRNDIGFGAGLNFPFGTQRSYFYPGIYIGHYIGTSSVFGGQVGYVGYVSKGIALHIEGGYRWGAHGSVVSNGVSYVPVVVGMRFALD